jgi:hypothetical protein
MNNPRERLDSWKEIADYLGRDRTTVMRWERSAGLPVRRVHGERGRAVFAYKAEIDRWLQEQPMTPEESTSSSPTVPTSRTTAIKYVAAASVLIGVILSGLAISQAWNPMPVSDVALAGRELVASDARGGEIWRVKLPLISGSVVPARLLLADIDAEAAPEVLAALHFMTSGRGDQGVVILVDDRGKVRWEQSLQDTYRFGDIEYGPPWFPSDIAVYRHAGETRIAVAYHHHTWWPGVVVTYDAAGRCRVSSTRGGSPS